MRSDTRKVLTRVVAATVNYAIGQGISMETITTETGIKRIELIDQESRLDDEVLPKLWRLLDRTRASGSLSLHMVSASSPSIFGPCEHLVRYAANLEAAMEAIVRFGSIIADRVQISLVKVDTTVGLQIWHPLDEVDGGNAAEVGVAMLFRLVEECQGDNLLVGVDFAHSPLGEQKYYERFFGVPVRFNQDRNTLLYRREALQRSMLDNDEHLFKYVQANLELIEDRWLLPGDRNLLSRIYEATKVNAELGKFSAEELAITLRISLRQLQRETKKHGLKVSSILDDIREVTAKRLLADRSRPLDEIATALDYSDARAFRRAFTRWTGQTPTEYRRQVESRG